MDAMVVKPIISEKSMRLAATSTYMFEVPKSANKVTVRAAIAAQFKVDPVSVRIANLPGKTKRFAGRIGKRTDTKRAFVTLKKDQKISAFEEQK